MRPLELILINGQLSGGTTKPLDIWAANEYRNEGRYVVKSFKDGFVNNYSTAKEIIACEVAVKFDIPTPAYGIIDITDEDLLTQYPDNEFRKIQKGYKFCSKFMEQYAMFNPLVSNTFLRQYDIENIFAFDFMMLNSDRGGFHNKPNLLINDDELIIIDHELTLPFINDKTKVFDYERSLNNYPYQKHTLLNHVKSIKSKNHIFDEFLEILSRSNFETLNSVFDDMDTYNINYGDRADYLNYFNWCKQNTEIIRKHLLLTI
ncbi:HipA family kinase [Flavobacterium alkalisoli]|uniref:HipA family kinase n=1 Tax=Flavobacterium alkalisoli TaxID=2602769 RepID=UPI003A8D556E